MSQGIHWDLYLPSEASPEALLTELRTYLWTLGFGYIGPVIHRSGAAADFSTIPDTDPDRYAMIMARRLVFLGPDPVQAHTHRLQDLLPLEVYGLLTVPASGHEPAVFDFGRYPTSTLDQSNGQTIATGCDTGWWGHGFCTTRGERPAHDRVLKALDFLSTHKAVAAIRDETHGPDRILDFAHTTSISDD